MRMLQSILFATDFDRASVEAIRIGSYLAKAFNSRISVLHVLKHSSQSVARYLRLEFVDIILQRVRKQFSNSEVMNAECSITVAPIADSILKKATEIDADLIVLGSGKISTTNAFPLGPVPHSVMEQATQPVLVVPCSLLVVKQEDIVEELLESDLRIISLLMAEGTALKGAGAFELGATKFRQVLARNIFHLAATESLAESLQKLGYADEAESYVRRANQLKGNDLERTS